MKCIDGDHDWALEFAASEKGVEPPSHRQCRNAGHDAQNVTAAPRFTLTLVVGFGYRFWGAHSMMDEGGNGFRETNTNGDPDDCSPLIFRVSQHWQSLEVRHPSASVRPRRGRTSWKERRSMIKGRLRRDGGKHASQ